MTRHTLYRLIPFAAALALAMFLSAPVARAEIRDGAKFFSADAVREGDQLIQQIRQRHGKDVVVETVPSMPGAPADAAGRERFFQDETARRGKEAGVNGLYILISRNPSSLYAGVDPQTQQNLFTLDDRARLRDVLQQHFKAKDFDGGLLAGLRLVDETMAGHVGGKNHGAAGAAGAGATGAGAGSASSSGSGSSSGAGGTPTNSPRPAGAGRGFGLGGWLCLGAAVLIGFAIFRSMMARRQMMSQGFGGQPGQPGYGQPGYGQPGYGYPPQQGGGFGRGILGGLLGGMAGGYLYDQMRGHGGGNEAHAATPPPLDPNTTSVEPMDNTSGFADFDDSGGGGADFGGGGDFGGGDPGGGGGDF
jgi:hypothetical protein